MKIGQFIAALVALGVVGLLFYYDRVETQKRESDTTDDRELAVEGLSFEQVNEFELTVRDSDKPDFVSYTIRGLKEVAPSEVAPSEGAESADSVGDAPGDPAEESSAGSTTGDSAVAEGSSWKITYPLNFPANESALRSYIKAFLDYRYDEIFEITEDRLPTFGLSDGQPTELNLKLSHTEHPTLAYRVGASTPVAFKMYLGLSTYPNQVLLGPRSSVLSQKKKLNDFLDVSLPRPALESGGSLEIQQFSQAGSTAPSERLSFTLSEPVDATDSGSATPRSDLRLTLTSHPELKERPSLVVVDDFIGVISGIDAGNWVSSDEEKESIIARSQRLVVIATPPASGSPGSAVLPSLLEIYRYSVSGEVPSGTANDDSANADNSTNSDGETVTYYVSKQGQLFEFNRDGVDQYFDFQLKDFLVQSIPLKLTEKELVGVKVTSHEFQNGDHSEYSLSQGLWVSNQENSNQDNKEEVAEESSSSEPTVEKLALDDSPKLAGDITGFVSKLFDTVYVAETAEKPTGTNLLLYSVELRNTTQQAEYVDKLSELTGIVAEDFGEVWEFYSSYTDYSKAWLHLRGSDTYYQVDGTLINDLETLPPPHEGNSDDNAMTEGMTELELGEVFDPASEGPGS